MERPDEPSRAPRARRRPEGQLALGTGLEPPPGRPLAGRVHARAHDTELAAAERGSFGGRRTQRVAVLEHLQAVGVIGSTDHELSRALGIVRPHVAGTRREELIRDGHRIVDSGVRRPTDTGRPAIVWRYSGGGSASSSG